MKKPYQGILILQIIGYICLILGLIYAIFEGAIPLAVILFVVMFLYGTAWYLTYVSHQKFAKYQENAKDILPNVTMDAMVQMDVPVLLTERSGRILWSNARFREQFTAGEFVKDKQLLDVIHLNAEVLNPERDLLMEHGNKSYRVRTTVSVQDDQEILTLRFPEVTDLLRLQTESTNRKPCVMLLVIDNYDDILQYAREREKAQVAADVERVLDHFLKGTDSIVCKVDNDLFYIIMESRYLHDMMESRFPVLDEARQIFVSNRMHITFSIGVGDGAETLAESEHLARQSLDMALGRGGDQAAVKTENGFSFFGGVSKGVEKKSKTKIRSMALAMQGLIQDADKVFLMGHRFGDLDCVGACCGMAGAIQLMEKPAYIVVNRKTCLAGQLINRMEQAEDGPTFIEPEEALEQITDNSLLIISDTHNKEILESLELYQKAKYVVVIDHHRKNVNYIENAVIFHHEPYASSASEMVTEILQYFQLRTEISAGYADALLAGIMLDTKNFVMRTGVRTFEAAAYLRKIGADTVQVKTLFSNTISQYSMRSQIVSHAEIFRNCAISAVKIPGDDIRVLAAQAADELLNIQGVEASFVIYVEATGVGISARSMGGMNVQVIMEQMGGGGHQTMAATQLPGGTIQEAKEQLLMILNK